MADKITDAEAQAARTMREFCNTLRDSREYATVVLPFLEAKRKHHHAEGTNVNIPAKKRAEHHHALNLANELLALLDTKREEAAEVIEQYRIENPQTFV